ncbi:MAG: hypothetical protein QOI38_2703, partial [Sphingomonadales bacterium]|nr:hypothetical protein [Sphingomonadales bacterium]
LAEVPAFAGMTPAFRDDVGADGLEPPTLSV